MKPKKPKTKKPGKPPTQPAPAAARSSPTVPKAGTPPAAETRRRKPVTPAELEQADRYLSSLWSKPAQAGWRNRLQRLTVQTRKNWVNS